MLSKLYISYAADQFKNDIFNRLGLIITNDILTFLKKIRFRIYEEVIQQVVPNGPSSFVVNYFVEREMVKAKGNPLAFTGMTSEFAALFNVEAMSLYGYFRNDYEANLLCLRSTVDGIDYGTKLSTQDWSGKALKIDWELELIYDSLSTPFTDLVKFTQKLNVKGRSVVR